MHSLVTLDFGDLVLHQRAGLPPAGSTRPLRSAKLAALALLITIPFAIIAGLYAARRRDRPADRAIVLGGLTSSSIPEFVTATILVVVVCVQLELLPVLATPRRDADVPTQVRYLLMPALGDGDRLLRLHRPHDACRHDRGPRVRLHPDRGDEGPDTARRCAAT